MVTRRLVPVIVFVLAFTCLPAPAGASPGAPWASVHWAPTVPPRTHYTIDCRIEESESGMNLRGTEVMRFTNDTAHPIARLALDWPADETRTLRLADGGTPARVLGEAGLQEGPPLVLLEFVEPLQPGAEATIELEFSRTPASPPDALPGYLVGFHPRLWWGFETHDDYDVAVRAPAGYVVGTSGVQDADSDRYRAEGVRSFGLFVATGLRVTEADADGVLVRVIHAEEAEECARLLLPTAVDAIGFFREMFGFYPHRSLTIAPGEPGALGGFPMATALVAVHAQERMPEVPQYPWRRIMAHEIAHQYWGEWVLEKDHPDWLWVGLGIRADRQWCAARGQDLGLYRGYLNGCADAVRKGADTRLERRPGDDLAGWDNHGKAYAVISALEAVVGREALDRVYRRCLQDFGGRRMGVAEFRAACEAEASQDLGWFFDQWVRSSAYPSYRVSSQKCEPLGEGYVSRVQVECLGTLRMPVPVEAVFEDGSRQRAFTERLLDVTELEFRSDSPLQAVGLDPDDAVALVVPAPTAAGQALNRQLGELPWTGVGELALELGRTAEEEGLDYPDLQFKLAMLLYDGRYYEEALRAFGRLGEAADDPMCGFIAAAWQGHALDLLGRREEAIAFYEEALRACDEEGVYPVTHSQYDMQVDRAWLEARLTEPFRRD
jgi:hypothetical protein